MLNVFFGISTLSSAVHPENAVSPMLIMDFGNVSSLIPVHAANASSDIDSSPDFIVSSVIPVQL